MGLFDDLKAKAEEMLGGNVEDITTQVGDVADQAQNIKETIIPGDEQGTNENN